MVHILPLFTIALGIGSALWLLWSIGRQPEPMAVMNWVWPLVALSGGPLAIWLYRRHHAWPHGKAPFGLAAAVATCHCGAGCTLGDVLAESLALAFPGILVWFGLGSLFGERIFAAWVLDFVLAYLLGIVFQYFSIAPMRQLDVRDGIVAALKADTLSLAAWQVGMYGAIAVVQFGIVRLKADTPEFWFAMQIAMLAGFCVAYPVNIWLLKTGLKEKM
jgi:hypothetical protein